MKLPYIYLLSIAILINACGNETEKPAENKSETSQPTANTHDHDHAGHDHSHDHTAPDTEEDYTTNEGTGYSPKPKWEVFEELNLVKTDNYAKALQERLKDVEPQTIDVRNRVLDAGGMGIWSRMDVYRLDDKIVQIEVIPIQGTITETFFYENWELVHVFVDPDGANGTILEEEPNALKYYYSRDESVAPRVNNMGIPSADQIRAKGNTVLNVAVNTK